MILMGNHSEYFPLRGVSLDFSSLGGRGSIFLGGGAIGQPLFTPAAAHRHWARQPPVAEPLTSCLQGAGFPLYNYQHLTDCISSL